MSRRWLLLLVGAWGLMLTLGAQRQRIRLMTYNVENLFDTIPSASGGDVDFTPQGKYAWTMQRYWLKLARLARVIADAGGATPVDVVALMEVENDSVVSHLVRGTKLWRLGYDYVMTHGVDERGINVALLYQPARFRLIGVDTLRVCPAKKNGVKPSRDVLHVAGELAMGDTLDVVAVHLPSRRGGRAAGLYRHAIALRVKSLADSLQRIRQHPSVVVLGDFNAFYPEAVFTKALRVTLPADVKQVAEAQRAVNAAVEAPLCLLSYDLKASCGVRGTYRFQGEWNQLDNVLVNRHLLRTPAAANGHLFTDATACRIFDLPGLLELTKRRDAYQVKRTYWGTYYHGGLSDHLPLLLDLFYE